MFLALDPSTTKSDKVFVLPLRFCRVLSVCDTILTMSSFSTRFNSGNDTYKKNETELPALRWSIYIRSKSLQTQYEDYVWVSIGSMSWIESSAVVAMYSYFANRHFWLSGICYFSHAHIGNASNKWARTLGFWG